MDVFADLHIHSDLPCIGPLWRRRMQGFRLDCIDRNGPERKSGSVAPLHPAPEQADPSSGMGIGARESGIRILGTSFYHTFALRPGRARESLFASIARFRSLAIAGGGTILERKSDLAGSDGSDGLLGPAGSGLQTDRRGTGQDREAFFLAVESLRYLRDPADVQRLWNLGVRALQPVHFLDTRWGGSSREGFLPAGRRGLTPAGRSLLAEMAGLGMALDIAHMNARTARECLDGYPGPVFCSHAGFAGLRPNARNVDADLARALFVRRGIVGVTCWRHLLGDPPPLPVPVGRGSGDGTGDGIGDRIDNGTGRESGSRKDCLRAAWTRTFCRTASALADLAPEGRRLVAIGSDRGAPIRAPAWFFTDGHREEIAEELGRLGWSAAEAGGFLGANAVAFLERALGD